MKKLIKKITDPTPQPNKILGITCTIIAIAALAVSMNIPGNQDLQVILRTFAGLLGSMAAHQAIQTENED